MGQAFNPADKDRTRASGWKLELDKLNLEVRCSRLLAARVVTCWNSSLGRW